MPNSTLEKIKANLPEWPDDVIDQWLLPHSEREGFGWPPSSPFNRSEWRYVMCRPVVWWQAVTWTKLQTALEPDDLSAEQLRTVNGMIGAYFKGDYNAYRMIATGPKRVFGVLEFLRANGDLPRMPVAVMDNDGLHIVDGNHRVVAWIIYGALGTEVLAEKCWLPRAAATTIWLGTHATGELLDPA
ncbi:hypothetical protein [Chelativorans alearense]|uniref:hypothetical protein n=1 Tax=Chelativorans alearense TaxID=2681495 RepID=UPI0013D6BAE5|nr:hypothetical protein [Chelativorans alearense]